MVGGLLQIFQRVGDLIVVAFDKILCVLSNVVLWLDGREGAIGELGWLDEGLGCSFEPG